MPARVWWLMFVLFACVLLYFQLVAVSKEEIIPETDTLKEKIEYLKKENLLLQDQLRLLANNRGDTPHTGYEHEQSTQSTENIQEAETTIIPFSDWKTDWKCYRREDYSEICEYKNLCFDGNDIIFLNPDTPEPVDLKGPECNVIFDWVYWEPYPYPPPLSRYVPLMSTFAADYKNPYMASGSWLLDNTDSIEMLDGGVYYGAFDMNPDNVWHHSMQGFGLWDAQILNETLSDSEKLPPQDYVIFNRTFIYPGFQRRVYQAATQPQTQFLLRPWFHENNSQAHQEYYRYSPWHQQFNEKDLENFEPPERQNAEVAVSKRNILCSKRAVIVSQKPKLFSGLDSSYKFRTKLYDLLGLKFGPPLGIVNNNVSKIISSGKVVVDFRGDSIARNLLKRDHIGAMIQYYGLTPILKWNFQNGAAIESQVNMLHDTDVYIIVHGAGITNEILMAPRSAVIEISPYGMRSPMYKHIAATLGVHHFEVLSWLKGSDENKCGEMLFTEEYERLCRNTSSIAHSQNICVHWSKKACVLAPMYDLEQALISAYDYLGINLNARVPKLFSDKARYPLNDYHSPHNTKGAQRANPKDQAE